MSDCNCGSCEECDSLTLLIPADGQDGAQGVYGGNSAEFIFDTSNVLTPAAGHIRADNANLSAATVISVAYDSVDTTGSAMTIWLSQIYSSTNANKATVRLFSLTDSSKFIEFTVTSGFTGVGCELTGTTTAVSTNSPFADGEHIVISYSIAGDAGTNGAAGTNGTTVLSNSNTTVNSGNTASSWVTQKTYQVLAAELDVNGDIVQASSQAVNSDASYATDSAVNQFRVQIINNAVTTTAITHVFSSYLEQARIDVNINRITNTTAQLIVTNTVGGVVTYIGQASVAGIDFTLVTDINVQANTTVSQVGVLNLLVTKFNA